MKTVLRYNIPGPDSTFDAPSDAKPLCTQPDAKTGQPSIWFLADPDLPMVKHQVRIFATGQLIHDAHPGIYVGTLQLAERGRIAVLHIFWRQQPIALAS